LQGIFHDLQAIWHESQLKHPPGQTVTASSLGNEAGNFPAAIWEVAHLEQGKFGPRLRRRPPCGCLPFSGRLPSAEPLPRSGLVDPSATVVLLAVACHNGQIVHANSGHRAIATKATCAPSMTAMRSCAVCAAGRQLSSMVSFETSRTPGFLELFIDESLTMPHSAGAGVRILRDRSWSLHRAGIGFC
jgi:hypothetical protein